MRSVPSGHKVRRTICLLLALLFSFAPTRQFIVKAQSASQTATQTAAVKLSDAGFRLEQIPVAGGAELVTIFGSLDGLSGHESQTSDVPLVSVLRDTLGDASDENDRLRYLWVLTYTKPSFKQRVASAIPFLYSCVGNKKRASKNAPPPIIDLAGTDHEVWNKIFWTALQNIFIDSYGLPLRVSSRTFSHNVRDYRRAHIMRALAILSLYEAETGAQPVFSTSEMRDIQARLMLTEKELGGIVDDTYLQRVFQKQTTEMRDERGHNWELLRQRAEAEGLYFEPLELPDGSATHALLWVARQDLAGNRERRFDSRFLNISNPWRDARLDKWQGYTETRYFDAENRQVAPNTAGARAVEMIPLALYGLDHPKIPIMLVDFRDSANPKSREASSRVIKDVTRNILALSRFGDLPYFLGRTIFNFVTSRRGMDINQPSRLRAYSELKLLLALDASLDPQLREEIKQRTEKVSLNPLENDLEAEAKLARDQYAALVDYARRPDGLNARLDRDRRAEMTTVEHSPTGQAFFRMANILTFGAYTHREKASPEMLSVLDVKRRLEYNERFLREVAKTSPQVEVNYNIADVRRALSYIAEHATAAHSKSAQAAALIFKQTADEETRQLCLNSLYRINNQTARNALQRINNDTQLDARWREQSAEYLRLATRVEQKMSSSNPKTTLNVGGQP